MLGYESLEPSPGGLECFWAVTYGGVGIMPRVCFPASGTGPLQKVGEKKEDSLWKSWMFQKHEELPTHPSCFWTGFLPAVTPGLSKSALQNIEATTLRMFSQFMGASRLVSSDAVRKHKEFHNIFSVQVLFQVELSEKVSEWLREPLESCMKLNALRNEAWPWFISLSWHFDFLQ